MLSKKKKKIEMSDKKKRKFDVSNMQPIDLYEQWHDDSELPSEGRRVMLLTENGSLTCMSITDITKWQMLVCCLSKYWWAYSDDVIPNAIKKKITRHIEEMNRMTARIN